MAGKPPIGSTRTPGSGNFQGVSPVLLSSSCDVLQINSAIPDYGQLSYPFRKAIVVTEIRWTLRTPRTSSGLVDIGPLVYTKLALGQKVLMRDAVPIWLLGTSMASSVESQRDLDTGDMFSTYRWILPKPLYVEAGQVLASTFYRGADGFGSINVQVTYVGKTVAPNQPVPRIITVPYAAPFVTTAGNIYQQSNENHLFNIFDRPLKIQRLTGRVALFTSGTTTAVAEKLTPATPASDITILMNDSWGGKMVNNNTGPSDVFDILRSAWTVDTVMPPKGVYEVRVWNIPAATVLHVGMIGYRDEEL